MSPFRSIGLLVMFSFPRVSGDEPPYNLRNFFSAKFSPRERG